ncbi:T-cell immunomodulatory protein [Galdieria sulphuraria]|nr:T-cell immunomodulatory protein [Galdieria sulphuraria]
MSCHSGQQLSQRIGLLGTIVVLYAFQLVQSVGDYRNIVDQSSFTGLSGLLGSAVSLADFNGDRQLDVLLYDANRRALFIALWSGDDQMFVVENDTSIQLPERVQLVSVDVADWNNDGILDILVIGTDNVGRIVYGKHNNQFVMDTELANVTADVLVLDANGDLVPDLFIPQKQAFYINSPPGNFQWTVWSGRNDSCQVSETSSAAFVDWNGDCLADLCFLSNCGLEIWLNNVPKGKFFYQLSSQEPQEHRIVQDDVLQKIFEKGSVLSFLDVNKDGTMDIVASDPDTKYLNFWLNVQKTRQFGDLCIPDDEWTVQRYESDTVAGAKTTSIDKVLKVPRRIFWGDINLDGYPDLLFIDESSNAVTLLENRGNWDILNATHFDKMKDNEKIMQLSVDTVAVAVVDIRGGVDILLSQQHSTRLLSIENHYPAEFFKAIGLSGLSYFSFPHSYTPLVGNTFKISYDGVDGRVYQICSQCPQSASLPLQSCDCFFGLKNMANYIAEVSLGTGQHIQRWENLMPNTVAVVWTVENENNWWMEIFTPKRAGQMLGVVIVLVSLSIGLGIGVLILMWQERRQDKREQYRRVNSSGFGTF